MELETATFQNPTQQPAYHLPFVIAKTTSDMKFVGMFYIIYGGLCCLTIIGALFGVPLILSGMRLREAADSFLAFRDTNQVYLLEKGFEQQGKSFNIQKILIIIGIVFGILYLILMISLLASGFSAFMNNETYY